MSFCPDERGDWRALIAERPPVPPEAAFAVSFWSGKWREAGLDSDAAYPPESLYESLKDSISVRYKEPFGFREKSMGAVDNKIAIVTGGARSLGAAEAALLAQEGAKVVIFDILDDRGQSTTNAVVRSGGDCRYLHCDVRRVEDWETAVAQVTQWHGRIDVLVNNAGVNIRESLLDAKMEHFEDVMATNLYGPIHGIRAVAPHMKAAGQGSIVNIVSTNSLAGGPFAAYATSKWALRGLIKCAALELAQWQIRVNAVCPGLVPTEINEGQPYIQQGIDSNPMGRAGTPGDVAALVLFLASDVSAYISGADIPVDGGGVAGTARYRGAKYTI